MNSANLKPYQDSHDMSLTITLAVAAIVGALLLAYLHAQTRRKAPKLPPGPPSFPIIGNLHTVGSLPHAALRSLALTYGPLITLWHGRVPTIVISSPEAAQLVYKTHDAVFAGRPKSQVAGYSSYGYKGIAFAEYGDHWRHVRKLCISNLLSPPKIATLSWLRKEEMNKFVGRLREAGAAHGAVNLTERLAELIGSITFRMIVGRDVNEFSELNQAIMEAIFLVGVFNIGDAVPILRPFDFQGILRRLRASVHKFEHLMDGVFADHTVMGRETDFVDVLLSLTKQIVDPRQRMDRTKIKALVKDLIAGSIETTATTVEWLIAEIIRHPRVTSEVRKELRSVVGMERGVEERDLPRLPYLEMVVKEGLRLHPAAALSVPRQCLEDITICGYHIPRGAKIFLNIWAMGRDPGIWTDNADDFIPERFGAENVDVLGQDFRILPFGSGRRVCPGARMAFLTLRLTVAHLFHSFDMELPDGVSPEKLDMSELPSGGLTTPRARQLVVLPKYRLKC